MKIQVCSDLHLETVHRFDPEWNVVQVRDDADVLVLAGDIDSAARGGLHFKGIGKPVLYVPGNHEAYGYELKQSESMLRRATDGSNVRVMNKDVVRIGDVTFIGCTLWTDYEIKGMSRREASMLNCNRLMADARSIWHDGGPFTAAEALEIHKDHKEWLLRTLPDIAGKKVLITHHGLGKGSIHERFKAHPANGGFVSDMTEVLKMVDLAIHGHVHNSARYRRAGTLVVANPRGKPRSSWEPGQRDEIVWENPEFDDRLVVEI